MPDISELGLSQEIQSAGQKAPSHREVLTSRVKSAFDKSKARLNSMKESPTAKKIEEAILPVRRAALILRSLDISHHKELVPLAAALGFTVLAHLISSPEISLLLSQASPAVGGAAIGYAVGEKAKFGRVGRIASAAAGAIAMGALGEGAAYAAGNSNVAREGAGFLDEAAVPVAMVGGAAREVASRTVRSAAQTAKSGLHRMRKQPAPPSKAATVKQTPGNLE